MIFLLILLLQLQFLCSNASNGDRSPFFQRCVEKCRLEDCSSDGRTFKLGNKQSFFNKLFMWSCSDECTYDCMWKTVAEFEQRKWPVPQFYGKWPFIRILGLQEPASALFSLLNLVVVILCYIKFKKEVKKNCPMYKEWTFFSYVSINTWIWSTIFHTRDVTFTEKMDYICSFSVVYCLCFCLICRLFNDLPPVLLYLLGFGYLLYFLNYTAYIIMSSIDYGFHVRLNFLIGVPTGLIWFCWCLYNSKRQPYVVKMAAFVTLASLAALLEVFDEPPMYYIFDFHSLFHLVSAPLIPLLYCFIIDDCKFLSKIEDTEKKKKTV